LIYFAGPGPSCCCSPCRRDPGPSTLLTASENVGILAAQALGAAVLFSAFCNLVPHTVALPGGSVANDGLGIIRSFSLPDSHFAALIGHTYDADTEEWQDEDSENW